MDACMLRCAPAGKWDIALVAWGPCTDQCVRKLPLGWGQSNGKPRCQMLPIVRLPCQYMNHPTKRTYTCLQARAPIAANAPPSMPRLASVATRG